jgi:hypothetical protein
VSSKNLGDKIHHATIMVTEEELDMFFRCKPPPVRGVEERHLLRVLIKKFIDAKETIERNKAKFEGED